MERKSMGWVTVYIKGKSGCESEVLKNLEQSGFNFMPGSSVERGLTLYWINESDSLRAFKKAIGSKTIFKYRIRFYTNVEDFIESKHNATPAPSQGQERASALKDLESWYATKNL